MRPISAKRKFQSFFIKCPENIVVTERIIRAWTNWLFYHAVAYILHQNLVIEVRQIPERKDFHFQPCFYGLGRYTGTKVIEEGGVCCSTNAYGKKRTWLQKFFIGGMQLLYSYEKL